MKLKVLAIKMVQHLITALPKEGLHTGKERKDGAGEKKSRKKRELHIVPAYNGSLAEALRMLANIARGARVQGGGGHMDLRSMQAKASGNSV
eukprot:1161339-Pelagomonas_calceolata.AAC.4